MNLVEVTTRDGYQLTLGRHEVKASLPWVLFVLPFGLPVQVGKTFAMSLGTIANVAVLESRLILQDELRSVPVDALLASHHATDVIDACMTLPVQPQILVGYCASAGIVMKVASTDALPLQQLVLVSGDYRLAPDQSTQYSKDLDSIFELVTQDPALAGYFLDKLRDTVKGTFAGLDAPYLLSQRLYRLAQSYRSYAQTDFLNLARNIQLPVLVLAGAKDKQINAASSVTLAAHLSDCHLVIDENGDHHELLKANSPLIQQIRDLITTERVAA